MGLTVHFEVLNQLGTPMMYSATLANRPAAGISGRIFFRTDSPYGIYRDTGSAWDQIAGSGGGGNTIYTGNDTLTSNRTVSSGGFTLTFTPQTTFFSSLNAAVNASSFAVLGSNTLTYAAAFNSNNIGNVYSANGAINSQIFDGNATFAQANLASAMVNVNKIDFSSGGHTVTMTQSTGIRAMTGVQNQIQFVGSHNGTITHAAVSQNLGFFREAGSTRTLTITNAYSHLINALDDYGAGFTFTNRWGIYQAGASDKNYFTANSLFGSTVDSGEKVQITGVTKFDGQIKSVITSGSAFIMNQNAFFQYSNGDIISATAGNIIGGGTTGFGIRYTTALTFGTGGAGFQFFTSDGALFAAGLGGVVLSSLLNASAVVQCQSTTKGFLPPRMTTTQKNAISTPAAGLVVYDTTLNKLCVYTTAWETVTSI